MVDSFDKGDNLHFKNLHGVLPLRSLASSSFLSLIASACAF